MKRTTMLLMIVLMLSSTKIVASASFDQGYEPEAIVCTPGLVSYTENGRTLMKQVNQTGNSHNSSSVTQTSINSVMRTAFASITVGGNAELSLIVSKIGFYTEVSAGVSVNLSDTITVNVPPYSTVYWEYGSNLVKTTGSLKYINDDCSYTNKTVTAEYTYDRYYRWWQ